jgi:hypothetical protein
MSGLPISSHLSRQNFGAGSYMWLGMRENTYLLTALLMLFMIIVYIFKIQLLPSLRKRIFVWGVAETFGLTATITLVIIFLRPSNQFIYFQF